MNDPNGMVYAEGEYHLFYQHYPDSTVWGPMHWGHAVSTDLVRWEHLPIALYPDSLGYIFSGSAVVDQTNSSGLGTKDRPPLVAIYTYHNEEAARAGRSDFQYQGLAYSTDRGRNWTKYAGNPVLPNLRDQPDFRDPKVIWDTDRNRWVMALAARDRIELWGSENLLDWTHLSDFGQSGEGDHTGVWECPDLFPLQVEGNPGETKWVLLVSINAGGPNGGSATQYFIGDFDGQAFRLDPDFAPAVQDGQAVWIDYGRDNYAGVSWANVPEADGRRIFLGWMSNWQYANVVPTHPWRSAMTVPRTLSLHPTPVGNRLFSRPVRELRELRSAAFPLVASGAIGQNPQEGTYEVLATFLPAADATEPFGIEVGNDRGERYRVGYDPVRGKYFSDRTASGQTDFSTVFADTVSWAPRLVASDTVRMQLLVDVASAELFADDGATVMTEIFFPTERYTRVSTFGDAAQLVEGRVYALRRGLSR